MAKGAAAIDIQASFLSHALMLLPSTYIVIGSASSTAPGTVRLIVESEDIAGCDMIVTCEVQDAGSTRTVRMVPCGRREPPAPPPNRMGGAWMPSPTAPDTKGPPPHMED